MKYYKQDVNITSLDASIDTHNASLFVDVGIAKTSSFLVLPMKIIDELIYKYCVRLQMAISIPTRDTHLACAQREFPILI